MIFGIVLGMLGAFVGKPDCPPKMAVGMTYREIATACPDISRVSFDRDDNSDVVFYLCPSLQTVVVGDLQTGKTVGLLMTPDRQNALRDSVRK